MILFLCLSILPHSDLHRIWVLNSNASFSSLWKMVIRTLWVLPPTINRKAPFPSKKICLPATRRLHGENKWQMYHYSLRYLLTNFKDNRREFFWDHTEIWSDCDSFSLCQIKNNKVSQFLHIKEVLLTKCQLGNPNPMKHKSKNSSLQTSTSVTSKVCASYEVPRQPNGVQEGNTRT